MPYVEIRGHVAPGFEPVFEAFRHNMESGEEIGASCAAWQHGECVVDLWAGLADRDRETPWQEDTLAVMFSATKGLVALAFLMLEDRGELDVDRPIAWYWPQFARGGKDGITVRQWLNHRSGLSAIDQRIRIEDVADHGLVETALVAQEPLWPPGSAQGYGATAWGLYAQAIFRRITGTTVGAWLRDEVFSPLDADVHLGTPRSEHPRIATLYPVDPGRMLTQVLPEILTTSGTESRVFPKLLFDRDSATRRALTNPDMGRARLNCLNEPWARETEMPWMNATGTARGLARVWGAVATTERIGRRQLLRKAALERVAGKQSWTYRDRVLQKPLGYSQGFIKEEAHLISPNEAAIGHTGAGGTVGFADPVHGLGFAYVMNRMDHHIRSPRMIRLNQALYAALQQS